MCKYEYFEYLYEDKHFLTIKKNIFISIPYF